MIELFFVSDIVNIAPGSYQTPLQEMAYKSLEKLQIPFERVVTDEAITMDDCVQINQKLNMKMVKTLFLCNRQKTEFYLFVTTADKSFKAKSFSNAMGISRMSFAPLERLETMLGVKIGAATVFGVLMDRDKKIKVIFDHDVVLEDWYGCSDGTTTGYMKIKTSQVVHDFLTYANHTPAVIQIEAEK
jgi:Ala-tRNA(Pro) deacylase